MRTRIVCAEHIIGLSAIEYARKDSAAARRRYDEIVAAGVLRPGGDRPRTLDAAGSTFALDTLAGDGRYIFLSRGERYRAVREPGMCYGFVFDAEQLVAAGAIVGPDLLSDYEALADEIARDLDARASGEPAGDDEMAEFAALFGDDPGLLAAVRDMSGSRYWDILQALEAGDDSTPEAAEAVSRFRSGAADIQSRRRVGGEEALRRLRRGDGRLEILFPGDLPILNAVGFVEAGRRVAIRVL